MVGIALWFSPVMIAWAMQWALVPFIGKSGRPIGAVCMTLVATLWLIEHYTLPAHLQPGQLGLDSAFAFGVWLVVTQGIVFLLFFACREYLDRLKGRELPKSGNHG
jgi:hypothetical protein